MLVPDEGIEPPTFGLQNRCTTAVLTRLPARFLACETVAAKPLRVTCRHAEALPFQTCVG